MSATVYEYRSTLLRLGKVNRQGFAPNLRMTARKRAHTHTHTGETERPDRVEGSI